MGGAPALVPWVSRAARAPTGLFGMCMVLAACSRAPSEQVGASAPGPQAPAAQAPTTPTTSATPARNATRQKIAGLAGFDSESKLAYAAAPSIPHVLKASYVFPDRARWWLGAASEQRADRTLRYRFGERCFVIPTGTDRSRELEADERDELIAQVELRRALMLWPDGFAWAGSGLERTCTLASGPTLRARLERADAEVPREIALLDPHGGEIDVLRVGTWQVHAGRNWPEQLELWHAGERIWSETIVSIDTTRRWMDLSFLPPDARGDAPSQAMSVGKVQTSDCPRLCAKRFELGRGSTWQAAHERAVELRAEHAPSLSASGVPLEPFVTITVDRELKPSAVLLRLASVPAQPPEGFQVHAERPVLWMYVVGTAQLVRGRLDELYRSLPADVQPGEAFVRFDPAHAESNIGIYLPLEAKH